jgi:acyl-CoA reductase-like NAD-dependent aldehyde dehydrogenase
VVTENAAELAVLLCKEQGKTLKGLGAEFEIGGCAAWAGYTAGLSLPVKILEQSDTSVIEMHREPLGVVGSITPWNFPLLIAIWHVVPAIRTGNTVVIKPSPFTPLTTLRAFEQVDKMVFTGSIATGKKIMSSAASTLKPVTLELGGNGPGIMLPDAEPEKLAERLFWGSMINSGQTCAALKRLYVPDSLFDATCEALVSFSRNIPMGDGMNESNLLGPLQNERQFGRVIELVEDAKANGAKVLVGGQPQGGNNYFYPVTFVTDIEDGTRLVDEEQFGPVLPIIRYSELDRAIERANGLEYGLDASVWGSDPEETGRVAARLEAGTVWINKHAEIAPHVPFGGIKCSGIGVEFGEEGLAAYTSIKVINRAA